jgi:hypothetical protein
VARAEAEAAAAAAHRSLSENIFLDGKEIAPSRFFSSFTNISQAAPAADPLFSDDAGCCYDAVFRVR